jgi:AraC-like DNA-binding protein
MRLDLAKPVDWDLAAARSGVSTSTFRRRWLSVSKIPPGRYLKQLRITEACRLLAETTKPIYEIAHMVGFADELYFSRRFHRELGMAPRTYRTIHQANIQGPSGTLTEDTRGRLPENDPWSGASPQEGESARQPSQKKEI